MADETDKLAAALQHILANYEGAEGDDQWLAAKEALDNIQPREMQLPCPKCGILHIEEGEWAATPHKKHQCRMCGNRWEPRSYSTFGVGIKGMDAREGTAFLVFFDNWVSSSGYPEDDPEVLNYRFIMSQSWQASREHWSSQFKVYLAKSGGRKPKKVSKKKASKKYSKRKLSKITAAVRSGKMSLDEVESLGYDPALYEKDLPKSSEMEDEEDLDIQF